ncbi:ATP-dependent DNA helicase [Mucilaginibacter sp. HD30]
MHIPTQHLSVRVAWHDAGWNGKVCCSPRENGSCMFLPRIQAAKDPALEESLASRWMHELSEQQQPPCIAEKATFMSPHDVYRKVKHPYASNPKNQKYYGHYRETTLRYPGYSFAVIPYGWMQKDADSNQSDRAEEYQLGYDARKEPELGFRNTWVQQIDNQQALLDAFIDPIRPEHSLVFIYAKNIPLVESTERILIGVGRVTKTGALTEYDYNPELPVAFRSTLWERPVYHSIRQDFADGFLLPYHDLLTLAAQDESINLQDYIAFAPAFQEFSYGSEWVSNDTAIEALLILHDRLKKLGGLLAGKDYSDQLGWIDHQISVLWEMRGPFPGIGPVLSGLKIPAGNMVARELDRLIRNDQGEVITNPWDYVYRLYGGDQSFLPNNLKFPMSGTLKATWENYSDDEKAFLELLSRMSLDNEQVRQVIDLSEQQQLEYLVNPYALYEQHRLIRLQFPASTIDKALFLHPVVSERFPLPEKTAIGDPLDERRIRAFCVQVLEQAAAGGNTLLTDSQLVTALDGLPLAPLCDPGTRNLLAIEDFLQAELGRQVLDEQSGLNYYKLVRYAKMKEKIKTFVQKRLQRPISSIPETNWRAVIDDKFGAIDPALPDWFRQRDSQARDEKAAALALMSTNRVAVLLGPAGTGKTTLIDILCAQPFIAGGTILKLAPTGKARVKMGKDAQTVAQYLIRAKRYQPETGQYMLNPDGPVRSAKTVIIDEASMLTEDQLAAVIDSLTGVERLILIGDYRQLPPIGAGRPFADLINYLQQQKKGIASLKVLFRQSAKQDIPAEEPDRLDVRLSKWFSDDPIKKEEINIFGEIAADEGKNWGHIEFMEWYNVRQLEEMLVSATNREISQLLPRIDLAATGDPMKDFNLSLGARAYYEGNSWLSFDIPSAPLIESWQILSPTRTSGYGTKVLNQGIQKTYRATAIANSIQPPKYKKRKMPRPVGNDKLVYGDKLINIQNTRWDKPWNYTYNPERLSDESLLKYMANGEIGLHVGFYGEWNQEKPRPIRVAFASQPGYAYQFKEADFQEDGDLQFELAYAITVHKSQGSGFNTVIFVIPSACPTLSRELFYTALTRQEDRILILHQGKFSDYEKYSRGEYSETARRLTDLFSEPQLKLVNKKFYDANYVQVCAKGEFMISKSEVIIADQLHFQHIPYAYEAPISDDKGIVIHPDFTIEDAASGIVYYWEHLGLMTKDDYRSKWKRKQEWYTRNGIIENTLDPDADKQLIITRDKPDGGIDAQEIRLLIEKLFI